MSGGSGVGREHLRVGAVLLAALIAVIAALAALSSDAEGQDSGADATEEARQSTGDQDSGADPAEEARQSTDRGAPDSGKAGPRDQPGTPADVVRVGMLFNDIQQLDLQSHSYNVDAYIWFKWDNPDIDPSRSFEFMNAFELWGHILTYESPKPERLPDGSYYQGTRIQGKFNTKLPLENYPFDTQELKVEIEDTNSDRSALVYEPDTDPASISDDLTIPGWTIGTPELEIEDNTYDTDFGDPRVGEAATFSRANFALPVTRPKGTYSLKLLLPMLLVALTAALSLLVHPQFVEGRIGIGITALLTLVALQLTSNSSLPEVDYLILLDKLYLISYAFVVLTLAVIVRNSWVDAEGDVARAVRADRVGIGGLSVAYVVATVLLFVLTLG